MQPALGTAFAGDGLEFKTAISVVAACAPQGFDAGSCSRDAGARFTANHDGAYGGGRRIEAALFDFFGQMGNEGGRATQHSAAVVEQGIDLAFGILAAGRYYHGAGTLVTSGGAKAADEPGVSKHALHDVASTNALCARMSCVQFGPAIKVVCTPELRCRRGGGARRKVHASHVGPGDGHELAERCAGIN